MISNAIKLEILQMFARTESEADPEGKATKFLEAIALTVAAVEDEASPDEMAWITNVRRSNCRALIRALQQLRRTSIAAWMAYGKVIRNFSQELRQEVSENEDIRGVLDHFFAMHCPLTKVTQAMLGQVSVG